MPRNKYFVTGTDTEVGKTLVTAGLLQKAQDEGLTTLGLKPVAAGCEPGESGLENEDALILKSCSTIQLPYQQVNPIALEPAIAPHIAAQQTGKNLQAERIAGVCRGALMSAGDFTLVEGAGGWRVPLNGRETMADLARALSLDVILVVGIRLGCLNHALLTAEAIIRDGLKLSGWVANCICPDSAMQDENIFTLERMISAPCIGKIPRLTKASAAEAAKYLDIRDLV